MHNVNTSSSGVLVSFMQWTSCTRKCNWRELQNWDDHFVRCVLGGRREEKQSTLNQRKSGSPELTIHRGIGMKKSEGSVGRRKGSEM